MTVSVEWHSDSGKTAAEIQLGHAHWVSDVSPAEGEAVTAPNPHDLLDSALGACTTLTIEFYAKRRGYPLTGIQVDVNRQEGGGVYNLDRTITLQGDLTPEQRQDLLRVAEHCPIHKALQGTFHIATSLQEG